MSIENPEDMVDPTFGAGEGLGLEEEYISWEPGDVADISIPNFPSRWRRRTKEEEPMLSRNYIEGSLSHSKPGDQAPSPPAAEPAPLSMTRLRDAVIDNDGRRPSNPRSSTTTGPQATPRPNDRTKQGDVEIASHPEALTSLYCPICGKELAVDNDGLNAHIDYCLSRGTIMKVASGR